MHPIFLQIQATPAMSTSHISILPIMSKWFFIPNIFSLYFLVGYESPCHARAAEPELPIQKI